MLRNFHVTGNEYSKIFLSGDYIQQMPLHHIAELLVPTSDVHSLEFGNTKLHLPIVCPLAQLDKVM